jgi:polar amino acid transport system substrate-binding protein
MQPEWPISMMTRSVARSVHPARRRGAWMLAIGTLLLAAAGPASADDASGAAVAPLRLCADPTNPPFSSQNMSAPGMYLELGAAIGHALQRPVVPVWEMTYYGKHAPRETLLAGSCDMSIGLLVGFMGKRLIFSHSFLNMGFALVTPPGLPPRLAALRGKRVAVQLGSPPQNLLAEHDEITPATFLDPESAVQALADGQVDAAFVWGPSAGYLNHTKLHDRFVLTPVTGPGMQWDVAIGFSAKQAVLRDQVDRALAGLGGTVAGLAAKYGFPVQPPSPLSWAVTAPLISHAAFAPPVYDPAARDGAKNVVLTERPVLRVTAVVDTTDDQKDAADRVAASRGAADRAFKPAATPTAVADGRTLFNGTCNHCHGPDAEQSVRKIDLRLLRHRYGGAMDEVFHYTVTHGREAKGMPNWSGVFTEEDFSKILAFLHGVQTN